MKKSDFLNVFNGKEYKIINNNNKIGNYKIVLYNNNRSIIIYILKNLMESNNPKSSDIKKSIKKIIKDITLYGHDNNVDHNIWKLMSKCIIVVDDKLYNNYLLKRMEDGFIINIKESEFNNLRF